MICTLYIRSRFTRLATVLTLLVMAGLAVSCASRPLANTSARSGWTAANKNWRGVHLWLDNERSAQELVRTLPGLAAAGANMVIVEVNYSFEFTGHPEMRNRHFVTKATAHQLAATARQCGIRLVPQFNCLGHQSFGGRIAPLLRRHPDFNETPSQSLTNKDMYCLSWCPRAPGLNDIVFSLIDDMADAFEADAFHVGMDEVYLIGTDECPRCRGANPAELFATQVNALHEHIVGQRHLAMLMWSDRIIGTKYQGISRFDTAQNDLSAAVDHVPRDIIQCDWHYEWKRSYPSVPYLTAKGFRVLACGFLPEKAAQAFSDDAQRLNDPRVLGFVATTWNETSITNSPEWPPIKEILPRWRDGGK